MVHDYATIAAFLAAIALVLYVGARLARAGDDWRRSRRTRRVDAKLRGVVLSRVGVDRVELPNGQTHERPAPKD